MIKTGIYLIRNTITNNPRDCYVGSASSDGGFQQRWNKHQRVLKSLTHNHHSIILQRAWNKYGVGAFKFEILDEVKRPNNYTSRQWKDLILGYEQYYLDTIQPKYNICKIAGNTFGFRHSDETKNKIRYMKKGQWAGAKNPRYHNGLIGNQNPMYGRKHSQKTKQKISQANKGRKTSDYQKQRVSEVHTGKIVSATTRTKISQAVKGERHPNAKLNYQKVERIKKLIENGFDDKYISNLFKVSKSTINDIRYKRTWK